LPIAIHLFGGAGAGPYKGVFGGPGAHNGIAVEKTTYFRELERVFGLFSHEMHAHLIRLSVLYEDLRIEVMALSRPHLEALDETSVSYRKNYFLRRSICTLCEFSETFRRLDQNEDFKKAIFWVRHFGPHKTHADEFELRLTKCIRFFDTYDGIIGKVRNDLGGHFGETTAREVIKTIAEAGYGQLRWFKDTSVKRAGVNFDFAEQITARAFMRHRGWRSKEGFARHLIRVVVSGYAHATRAVHVLVLIYLQERFSYESRIHSTGRYGRRTQCQRKTISSSISTRS